VGWFATSKVVQHAFYKDGSVFLDRNILQVFYFLKFKWTLFFCKTFKRRRKKTFRGIILKQNCCLYRFWKIPGFIDYVSTSKILFLHLHSSASLSNYWGKFWKSKLLLWGVKTLCKKLSESIFKLSPKNFSEAVEIELKRSGWTF